MVSLLSSKEVPPDYTEALTSGVSQGWADGWRLNSSLFQMSRKVFPVESSFHEVFKKKMGEFGGQG